MRIIVAGGRGFFGRTIVELMQADGLAPLVGSRGPGADLVFNVEDSTSLRAALRAGDIVIDTVGPFQDRLTVLVKAAIEIGFDVIDLSDRAYRIGATPAVLAARNMACDRFARRALLACDELVATEELFRYLSGLGVRMEQS